MYQQCFYEPFISIHASVKAAISFSVDTSSFSSLSWHVCSSGASLIFHCHYSGTDLGPGLSEDPTKAPERGSQGSEDPTKAPERGSQSQTPLVAY